ncbi:hypothetical protein AXX12_07630 [Anaerosporomusa subterranea]|uniref:Uncharacterized protein n=1 Tax=Anaerosporomusa subterranea TaxID=1794912 RepID=A0A154BQX4_ANASB|nr:hypothetical protein AXX12_07630 [Anaerosporomusa subterranea]
MFRWIEVSTHSVASRHPSQEGNLVFPLRSKSLSVQRPQMLGATSMRPESYWKYVDGSKRRSNNADEVSGRSANGSEGTFPGAHDNQTLDRSAGRPYTDGTYRLDTVCIDK